MAEEESDSITSPQKEAIVVGLVSSGYFLSGVYLIVLPPIFPLLSAEFSLSNTALGVLMSVFALASGLTQMPIGILVDKIGARWVLISGAGISALVVTLFGFATTYIGLLLLVALLGVAMGVFQTADYAILSASVDKSRLGRAFSLHTFGGNLGIMAAPLSIGLTAQIWDWRVAMFVAGSFGFLVFLSLLAGKRFLTSDISTVVEKTTRLKPLPLRQRAGKELGGLLTAPFLMFLLFFVVMSMGGAGVRTFTVTAMVDFHSASLTTANAALTIFYFASSVGILVGGVVADRTNRHDLAVFAAVVPGTLAFALMGGVVLPIIMITSVLFVAGFGHGALRPSRDKMIQLATTRGSIGRTFGFITSGAYCGNALTPALFGWIIDQGEPRAVFWLIAVLIFLQGIVILFTRKVIVRRKQVSEESVVDC